MFARFFDNSKIKEKIYDKVLEQEIVYKEDNGDGQLASLRHGILNEEMVYKNRKVITTRNGQTPFIPRVKMYFNAINDLDSTLVIDIFDHKCKCLIKKFTIKSSNNEYTIEQMKSLVDEIKTLLDGNDTNKVTKLIELIRNKQDLKYEEVAQ